jgi:hypothetical protein
MPIDTCASTTASSPVVETSFPGGRSRPAAFRALPDGRRADSTKRRTRRPRASAAALGALAVSGLILHAVGLFVFAKVLESPGSTGARRVVTTRAAWGRTLPGLSAGASAVALAHLRLGLRTPRGRSILLSPILMVGIFAFVMRRPMTRMDMGPFAIHSGLSLAAFGSFICLMAIMPIAMNQFAVDKAGLTMMLLSPLTDREYLTGKAVGNGLIAAIPATFSITRPSQASMASRSGWPFRSASWPSTSSWRRLPRSSRRSSPAPSI